MLENNFASIGKSVLIHAIGLQDNHKISHELDRKASGCFSCPNLRASLKNPSCSKCSQCQNRKFKDESYINEKNRYGYQPSLSMCSIKLFTYLHFFITGLGVIEDLKISDAAKTLHMSQRSVHNSLKSLEENDYISYVKNRPGSYLVVINQYEDYFKKANEGGRGYIILSREFFHEVIASTERINELRLYFRMYLNVDDRKFYPVQPSSYLTDSRKITDICRYFPHYMKPVHIRKLIQNLSSVFAVRQEQDAVTYSLDQDYFGDLQKNLFRSECASKLEDLFTGMNASLHEVFEKNASIAILPDYLMQHVVAAKLNHTSFYFESMEKDKEDMIQIAVQYGYEIMFRHLKELLQKEKDILSLTGHYGEYIRFSIEQELYAA